MCEPLSAGLALGVRVVLGSGGSARAGGSKATFPHAGERAPAPEQRSRGRRRACSALIGCDNAPGTIQLRSFTDHCYRRRMSAPEHPCLCFIFWKSQKRFLLPGEGKGLGNPRLVELPQESISSLALLEK